MGVEAGSIPFLGKYVRRQYEDNLAALAHGLLPAEVIANPRHFAEEWDARVGGRLLLLNQTTENQRTVVTETRLSAKTAHGDRRYSEEVFLKDAIATRDVIDLNVDQHRHLVLLSTTDAWAHVHRDPNVLLGDCIHFLNKVAARDVTVHGSRLEGWNLLANVKHVLAVVQRVELRSRLNDGFTVADQRVDASEELSRLAEGLIIKQERQSRLCDRLERVGGLWQSLSRQIASEVESVMSFLNGEDIDTKVVQRVRIQLNDLYLDHDLTCRLVDLRDVSPHLLDVIGRSDDEDAVAVFR